MTIRSLDFLDLPTLHHYRGEAVSLDTTRALTRGNPLGAIGLMAYMNPGRHVYSAVCAESEAPLLGGIIHTNGEGFARLLYLAPASRLDNPGLPELIEHLCTQAGTWGAMHVRAELDKTSEVFEPLRRSGFAVYASQRMWDVTKLANGETDNKWPRVKSVNLPAMQSLYHQIVPPLLQPVEPAPKRATGFICSEGGTCFASTATGLSGVVVFPLIHPDATDVANKLLSLICNLPNRGGRPIYVCVRTYQAWLERVLEDLGAESGPQQAVMVKHLARMVKEEQVVRAAQPARVSVQPSRVSHFEEKKLP
jgi:hypothetical protein